MSFNLNSERKKKINQSWELMRDIIEFCGKRLPPEPVILDVGSGEGILALKIAGTLKAKKVILTDIVDSLEVQLPRNAEFHQVDLCSMDFLQKFQNRVQVVICLRSFHEFSDPVGAMRNLFGVLPIGGTTLIFDYSKQGWAHQRTITLAEDPTSILHFQKDIKKAEQDDLNTDEGIREFWEGMVFPRVPGECHLFFNGDIYTVVYTARQWGEVKPIPPGMEQILRRLGHIK